MMLHLILKPIRELPLMETCVALLILYFVYSFVCLLVYLIICYLFTFNEICMTVDLY